MTFLRFSAADLKTKAKNDDDSGNARPVVLGLLPSPLGVDGVARNYPRGIL